MGKKILIKLKKIIKTEYKIIVIYCFILFLAFYKLDYQVFMPGDLDNLSKKIEVENATIMEGTYNSTSVKALRGSLLTVGLSYIIPNWDLIKLETEAYEDEEYEEVNERNKLDLLNGNEISKYVALKYASKNYEVEYQGIYVYYVYSKANTDIKVGDVITKIDGENIYTSDDIALIFNNKSVNSKFSFEVIRNGQVVNCYGYTYEENNKKVLGIVPIETIKIKSDLDIEFEVDKNEGGSSAGLMNTLYIYDALVSEDLTKGYTIAGTGTISIDGKVGEIGGVKYKLMGAVKHKADIFIVPEENYEEALEIKKENGYDIKLIKASTFEEVLEELDNL